MGLTVAVDGRLFLHSRGGVRRYAHELLGGLARAAEPGDRFVVLSPRELPPPLDSPHVRVQVVPWAGPSLAWLRLRAGRAARQLGADCFWSPAAQLPGGGSPPTVLSVYDLAHRLVPRTLPWRYRIQTGLLFAGDVARATTVVSCSQGTSRRLERHLGRPADAVVRPGVAQTFRRTRALSAGEVGTCAGVRAPYLLTVGTLQPRKGQAELLTAAAALRDVGAIEGRLVVLAGARGWRTRRIDRAIQAAPDWVRVLGWVDDERLASLYAAADLVVCASQYEGFGIPVLEARACGARILAADRPELREAGEGDAMYAEPTAAGLAAALPDALRAPRPTGPLPAWTNWNHAAAALRSVLIETAGQPASSR